jgi:CubicO group peptidase (beta-lactamase class C family)
MPHDHAPSRRPKPRLPVGALLALVLLLAAAPARALVPLPAQPDGVPWPTHAWPTGRPDAGVDATRLAALIDEVLAVPAPEALPGTRAVLVVHRGRLVAERYAAGFGPARKVLGQSVAKTVTGALAGIAARDLGLDLDAPAPVAAWRAPDDPRRAITLRHLLRMTDGLDFNEAYFDPFGSDVLPMLFGDERRDMAAYAASRPPAHPPGARWAYSSGTTNILSGVLRDAVGGTREAYLAFMRQRLFDPVGMASAEPEFDEAGTFVGSSWLHATPPDWARFGLLLLRGGVWEGRAVLPAGWVDLMRTPHTPDRTYGAHVWLNAAGRVPGAPPDLFMATGNGGQVIAVVPSKDLVVVRLGRTGYRHYEALYRWLGQMVGAFPDAPA